MHHTYDFPTDASYLSYVNNIKSRFPGKATWMSVRARGAHVPFMLNFVKEICCSLGSANGAGRGWSGGYDPTIGNALMFAGLVFQSFVLAGEPHYDVCARIPWITGSDENVVLDAGV